MESFQNGNSNVFSIDHIGVICGISSPIPWKYGSIQRMEICVPSFRENMFGSFDSTYPEMTDILESVSNMRVTICLTGNIWYDRCRADSMSGISTKSIDRTMFRLSVRAELKRSPSPVVIAVELITPFGAPSPVIFVILNPDRQGLLSSIVNISPSWLTTVTDLITILPSEFEAGFGCSDKSPSDSGPSESNYSGCN